MPRLHAHTAGLTVEFCQAELTRWLGLWHPRTDWVVLYESGLWRAANDEFALSLETTYERAIIHWCDHLARGKGLC